MVYKLPDVPVECDELLPYSQKGSRILHDSFDLQPVAHDAFIVQKELYFSTVISCNLTRVKVVERLAVIPAFTQYCDPA